MLARRPRLPHRLVAGIALSCVFGTASGSPAIAGDEPPAGLAFRVAKVVALDDTDTVINNAIVLVKGNRIESVGPADTITIPDGYRILDLSDQWLLPGIV